jgi:lipopolysaccharide/colanic/teichoic acid biosynthesis glycosyltransferase
MRRGRSYCRGPLKRGLDAVVSLAALLILSPVLLLLALAILVTSGRPVLFTQKRIGMDGKPFSMLKFRSMRTARGGGLPITGAGDPRVTGIGRFLRATKLDELPQLVNVVAGEMSLVGPRPEVPRYVAHYNPAQRSVLEARPGMTDPASVLFRDEEALLGSVPEESRERYYLEAILPRKLAMNRDYIDRASLGYDLALVLQTVKIVLLPPRV